MRLRAAWSSACLVRVAHPALSWGITLGLFLHSTDLRRQAERGDLLRPLLFLSLVLCSVLLYFAVSLMDPGYVEQDGDPKQPMRARHCQACRHCVRRYDHHCPWIENCVGERNHSVFIVYLAIQLVVLLWALLVAWSGLHFEQPSWAWLHRNLLLLLSFLVVAVFAVVVLLLLACHLYLASCNTTTWEFMSSHRISYLRECEAENPFDQGVFLNLWRFFCASRLVTWENLYAEGEGSAM
ncbi:palmitoyltransferase ZDHHC12 isoform X2 [Rhineura floridana]|uniref:palmitoyltransferase ZDHHC12 isoform X2 n=1 Tax=Rhineura floridana TaxID=261503 RepID=UPI002AC8384A|nr:palmitoyltransferase ZDHHC12 isoform X2 [Rhineura floridana]